MIRYYVEDGPSGSRLCHGCVDLKVGLYMNTSELRFTFLCVSVSLWLVGVKGAAIQGASGASGCVAPGAGSRAAFNSIATMA